MSPTHCLHLAQQPEQEQGDVKDPTGTVLFTLCMKCLEIWQNDERRNPAESEAYNIYRSTDPNTPKDQWVLLNDKPIPRTKTGQMQYRDTTAIPGATYYVYIITLNALGLMSDPSEVIKIEGGDVILDV